MLAQEPLNRTFCPRSPRATRRRAWKGLWPLLLLVGLTSGCATFSGENGLEEDLGRVQTDLSALSRSVQRALEDAEKVMTRLDRRIRDQEGQTKRESTALSSRLRALERGLESRIGALENDLADLAIRVMEASQRLMEVSQRVEELGAEITAAPPPEAPTGLPSLKVSPKRRP